jgi:molybdenum cofactor cytidylyltransferase
VVVISAIVLAAGRSLRMGQRKLLLDLDGKPLVRWAVEGVLPLVSDVIAVTGPDAAAVHDALAGLPVRFAVNPRPEDGQGTTIAAGAQALGPATDGALVVLGDQPWLPSEVVPALLETFRTSGAAIVTPVYRGVQGTPVLFASSIFPELRVLTGDAGAKPVVQRDAVRVVRVPFDVDMPLDVDTPEDLARAMAWRARRVQ